MWTGGGGLEARCFEGPDVPLRDSCFFHLTTEFLLVSPMSITAINRAEVSNLKEETKDSKDLKSRWEVLEEEKVDL